MQRTRLLAVCAWLFAVAGGAVAHADDGEARARAHYQLGRTAFTQGHYERAIKEFEIGYRNKPLPAFLYNIAQVAELTGQAQKALDQYRRYLELRPNAPERDEVTRHIATLERALGSGGADQRAVASAPAPSTVSLASNPDTSNSAASTPASNAAASNAVAPGGSDEHALQPASNAIVAGSTHVPPPKRDHHKLVIGLSVAGAVLVVGAAAVGAVVGEQTQAEYHSWGTLGITPH